MKNRTPFIFTFLVLGGLLSAFSTGEVADKSTTSDIANSSDKNVESTLTLGIALLNNIKADSHVKNGDVFKRRDTFGYTHGAIGIAFIDISISGTNSGLTGDDAEVNITMPFEFDLYGTVSRDLRVSTNGTLLFDATAGAIAFTNVTFPSAANPLMIAPYWDDMDDGAGDVFFETQGTAPNRSFIIHWNDWASISGAANAGDFEVILYEGTNNIDFVYQDTNFDGTHDDGESATVGINRNGADAELNSFNTDDGSVDNGLAIRFVHPDNLVGMSFTSSTTTQAETTDVTPGSTDNVVVGMEIVMDGNTSPLSVTNFDFNTTGTSNAANDIENARVYYTGTSPTFDTGIQYGATTAAPDGTFSIANPQTLVDGTNYFWLSYDIQSGATNSNVVDAQCTNLTVGSVRTPTVTSPGGSRTIFATGFSCDDAIGITSDCGTTVTINGTTVGGDTSLNIDCGPDASANTAAKSWYTFTGNGASVTATTSVGVGTPLTDTQLWVYSGTCAGLTCVAENDDAAGLFSSVTFTAAVGTTYYIVVGDFVGTANVGTFQLDVTFDAAQTYGTSMATQNISNTIQSATDQQVIGVEVVMATGCDPIDVTSLTFNTAGSTDAANDIANAKVYSTGTSATFATTTQLGATEVGPNGVFTISGFTQSLEIGTNHFWLAYDIEAGATDDNIVDAQCTSIIVDGITQTPTTTSPVGSRRITATPDDVTVLRGNQLSFDGGDHLEAVGFTGITGSNNRTIEMWMKTTANATDVLMDFGSTSVTAARYAFTVIADGSLVVFNQGGSIATLTTGTDFIDVSDGEWHHIAAVLDGTTFNDVDFYVDGLLQDKGANGNTVNTIADNNLFIGSTFDLTNEFTGEMDEVRLWDDARTQDEIRENMHITLTGTEPNLVSYWQFNEDSGTTHADVTGTHTLTRGDGATTTTFPTIETSTVAVAGGTSDLQTINATGVTTFTNTNVSMNFTTAPASTEFVVYKLTGEDAPGNVVTDDIVTLNEVTSSYWVVRHFNGSTPITFATDVIFDLGNGGTGVDATDAATPSNLKLLSRASNSFGTWTSAEDADAAVEASGVITFNGVTTFSQLKVGSIASSALPITLKSFEGFVENGEHRLEWVTSSEINNDRFEIQRSPDGKNFEVIAIVDGAGTSSEEQQYYYIDNDPFFQKNYYRLRQIDIDGQSAYADRIVLLENTNALEQLSYDLYPNPTDRTNINLNISSPDSNREIHVSLYDIYGRRYYYRKVEPNKLNTELSINTEYNMNSGMYLMIVEQGDQKLQKKLIIE